MVPRAQPGTGGNIDTCLLIMQHRINLATVAAPAAAVEYARRLAQRGTPLTALLRAYRVGHARFSDWLRNRSAARTARIRDLLSGERADVSAAEATLGYRLRQYHVGLVCWVGDAAGTADEIGRLEHAISHVAAQVACGGDPVFLPRDESSAWAWLPLGIRDTFDAAAASTAALDGDVHVAFGDVAKGATGFRLTHAQAVAAQAVALAAGSPPRVVAFGEVAPVAMMLGSTDLLRAWVLSTLAGLATDEEHNARLRGTLLLFLHMGGSYKLTAERLMLHKNTVQYRIRKAEESLGRPVAEHQHDVELALRASQWLGSSVLQHV